MASLVVSFGTASRCLKPLINMFSPGWGPFFWADALPFASPCNLPTGSHYRCRVKIPVDQSYLKPKN